MAINEKYSYKDFMDKDLTALPASDFNNSKIIGSCFYQQATPDTQVFPIGITGVTFSKSNLENVFIPPGNTIESDCSYRKIVVQNDLEDWVVDDLLKPLEPCNKKAFEKLGLSIVPINIPVDFIRKETTFKTEWERTKDLPEVTDWFIEPPQIISQITKLTTKIIPKTKWDSLPDKNVLTSKFDDGSPSISTKTTNRGEEVVVLKGLITRYIIEGKGLILIQGRKPRPFDNVSVTRAKAEADNQADIDAVKALGSGIAERLGIN